MLYTFVYNNSTLTPSARALKIIANMAAVAHAPACSESARKSIEKNVYDDNLFVNDFCQMQRVKPKTLPIDTKLR